MPEQTAKSTERVIAQKTQETFEFYLLSLVFTLLALSIQTAKFGTSAVADALELMGWVSFVVSGLAGLSRLEWIPGLRLSVGDREDAKNHLFELKEIQARGISELDVIATGTRQPIAKRVADQQEAIAALDPLIEKLERWTFTKYNLHKYGFVLGLLCVVAARAFKPLSSILSALHALC